VRGPLVSVITAAYNSEDFLGEALRSLFAQDYEPFEAIVVDDGSTDGTPEVAQAFPVVYLRQENAGPAAARNAGLAVANGELVAILDADDLLPPNKLSIQVGHLLEHPEVACVLGRQEWINPPEWLTRDSVYGELDGIPLPSAVFRKDVLDELGGFDQSFRTGEDMDLLVRMRQAGHEIIVMPDLVLYRRFHGSNLTYVARPATNPLLRSLRAKLERERAEEGRSE
jgi:glycosyltransferase involved in cell wall biosynthesis